MAVTMKDIAKELGVSVVTVSKVLRNHDDISEETRQRVLRRMNELNYRPNLAARALVTGRTGLVGLVVPDLVHPFFAQIAKALSKVLRKHGYGVVISSSEEDPNLEREEIEYLLGRRVDALILASAQSSPEFFSRIEQQNTPYVLIDRTFPGLPAHFFGVDDEAVGRLAVEHLLEQGCRRIAHIRGPEVSTALGRLAGYKDALARRGWGGRAEYVVCGAADDAGHVTGYGAMKQLLALDPRPDGVFCFNDPTALGAMHATLDADLRVPDNVALVGCGNVFYSSFLRVPLTTIEQNSSAIGERAAKLVVNLIASKSRQRPRKVLLEPKLIVRASSVRQRGRPPKAG